MSEVKKEEKKQEKMTTEKQETAAVNNTQKPVNKKGKPDTVVYVGPSIHGVVQTSTVFTNGIPRMLTEKMKEIPAISSLIVPIRELGNVKSNLMDGKSAVSACYKNVVSKLKEEV